MTGERKHAAITRRAEDFHGGAHAQSGCFKTRFRRLAPTRGPVGTRALLSEYHPGYGPRPAVRPVPGGSARPGHATVAGCRDWPDRPEQQRPRVRSFWLDRAARHASMNGVLNDGVRGASWVPPERRPSEKRSAADYQQNPARTTRLSAYVRSFLPIAL